MTNLSKVADEETARTCPEAAVNRAVFLRSLGAESVLELCVGPSLRVLQSAYDKVGIPCTGNDISFRWQQYYPQGTWIIGDALKIRWNSDAVVFGPPLSRGCTGRREDALLLDDVSPGYRAFLSRWASESHRFGVLVLPSRVFATRWDRQHFHRFMKDVYATGAGIEVHENKVGRRGIRKYVELYLTRQPQFKTEYLCEFKPVR